MTTPITQKAKVKGIYPSNQEVTLNADGSGGPIFKEHKMYKGDDVQLAKTKKDHLLLKEKGYGHSSPFKQTSEYKKYKATATSRFPNFNVKKDTMIVSHHGDEMTAKSYNTSEALIGKKKGLIDSISSSDGKTEYNGELYRQSNVYPKTSKQVTAHAKHAEKTNS